MGLLGSIFYFFVLRFGCACLGLDVLASDNLNEELLRELEPGGFYKWFPQMLPSFLPVVCSTFSPVTDGVSVDRILGGGEGGKMVGTGKPITTSSVNYPELALSPSKHLRGPPKTLSFGDSNGLCGLWKTQSSLPGLRA